MILGRGLEFEVGRGEFGFRTCWRTYFCAAEYFYKGGETSNSPATTALLQLLFSPVPRTESTTRCYFYIHWI
jgi:hypothetical protein